MGRHIYATNQADNILEQCKWFLVTEHIIRLNSDTVLMKSHWIYVNQSDEWTAWMTRNVEYSNRWGDEVREKAVLIEAVVCVELRFYSRYRDVLERRYCKHSEQLFRLPLHQWNGASKMNADPPIRQIYVRLQPLCLEVFINNAKKSEKSGYLE